MRRLSVWFFAALLVAVLSTACGGDGPSLEDALRRMVLQPEQLPELELEEETFTTNQEIADSNPDPKARLEMLESWGRLLGYEVAYRRPPGAADLIVQGVNVSASLYSTEKGASDSFADAARTAEETDWEANYPGLEDFRQEEIEADNLADEIVWLRLSGFQPADGGRELVTDDLIFFRQGRERGFLRVLAGTAENEERGHFSDTVEAWLRTLVQNVREALPQVEEG